jgi:hypothetical protein
MLGEDSLDFEGFLEVLKKPEAVRLFADMLPAQLSRKHRLGLQQQRVFHSAESSDWGYCIGYGRSIAA